MHKQWIWLSTSVVVIWAAVLRLFALGQASYWLDEGYSVTIARAITQHGYPLMDSGNFIWRAPLYHYLLAGVVAVMGDGELATRLLSVIIGLAAMAVLTYCAKRWFGTVVAGVALLLTSFSVWEITWSRQARMYILLQVVFWLAVLIYERWLQTRRHFWLVPLVIAAALAVHQFALLLCLALPAYRRIQQWHKRPWFILGYSALLIMCVVVVTVVLHYGLNQPVPVNYLGHYFDFLWRNHGVMLVLAGTGVVIALRKQPVITLWLVSIGLVGFSIFSYSVTLLQYRYLFFLFPIVIWFSAITLSWLMQHRYRWLGIIVGLSCIGLLFWHNELTIIPQAVWLLESDAPTSTFSYKSFTPQPDFWSAYQFIQQQNSEVVITPYPELTRLYLERDDTYALYLDLIGTKAMPNVGRQLYTGVSYITFAQLELAREQRALVLIDTLAQYRIPETLYRYIKNHSQVVYEHSAGDWSNITVYQLEE